MRKVFPCLIAVILSVAAALCAQNLVSFKKNGTMTVAQTNQMITKAFGSQVAPTSRALDLYKISYRSRDEKNRAVVLSGLVVFPKGGAPKGLDRLQSRDDRQLRKMSPSRFTGKANNSEAQTATLAFASGGYAVVMPDYLGFRRPSGPAPVPARGRQQPLGRRHHRTRADDRQTAQHRARCAALRLGLFRRRRGRDVDGARSRRQVGSGLPGDFGRARFGPVRPVGRHAKMDARLADQSGAVRHQALSGLLYDQLFSSQARASKSSIISSRRWL